jgi:glyoxylase-like metal-dependent hydrolase (beta-lactamase superfamily II)/ferredoxin
MLRIMARPMDRNAASADGDWYVDTGCIGCGAARHVAPGLIAAQPDGKSIFLRQPDTDEELDMAWRALLVCPTRSVGNEEVARPYPASFPHDLGDGVYRLGHNAKSSFGAHSYLVTRPTGNFMIDSPRWTREVVGPIDELGGIDHILLSHRDDVADYAKYADRFGARVWIHEDDVDAAPDASDVITGAEARELFAGVEVIPIPGHTKGSVLFVVDGHLMFSGDSLSWNPNHEALHAFRDACWYSWDHQRASLKSVADGPTRFDRLFCGHGWSHDLDSEGFHELLIELVDRM